MASNSWTTDPEHIDLLNYLIEKTKEAKSPLNIVRMVREYKEQKGSAQTERCLVRRISRARKRIHRFEHIDMKSKVKMLFALSVVVKANFLKALQKDALVEVDDKQRIIHYEAHDGNLQLKGNHSLSAKLRTTKFESKQTLRSWINNYFENKNDSNAIPKNKEEKDMGNLIEFITEKCHNVSTPLSIRQLASDFNEEFGSSRSLECIRTRIRKYCREIQKIEFLDTHSKVEQLFCLGVKLDSDFLKQLQKDAVVEVNYLNRITKYTSNDGSLTLCGDQSLSAKKRLGCIRRRRRRTTDKAVEKYLYSGAAEDEESEKENGYSEDDSDEYSSEEFDSEFSSDEENDHLDETEALKGTADDSDNETPVRNRSSTEMSINDNFDFDPPTERSHRSEETVMRKDEEKENDPEIIGNAGIKTRYGRLSKGRYPDLKDDSDEYCPEKLDIDSRSENGNGGVDISKNAVEPSNEAHDFGNEIPAGNRSEISIDDNFDFDPPTERTHRSEETEMREHEKDDSGITGNAAVKTRSISIETLPKNNTSSSTSHTPKTPKRKADASGSNSSKRTKPPLEKSMNPLQIDDNISYDGTSRVELEPVRESRRFPNGIEDDSDIQQIPKPRLQIMETPIKKEHEEEVQTSLKMVMNAFKSLVLSLDTPRLSQFQMEIDKRIMEAGRRIEVSNKEVILAMDFLIVKLSKYGSPKSHEDSISLRDILLMLRTILLNSSFNGLELILEMLKENIEQLKIQDKKVPVSKVECVLRATLNNSCT